MTAKRDVPRVVVVCRFEPDLLAAVDISPGLNRHAKIMALIEKGLQTDARETQAEAGPRAG